MIDSFIAASLLHGSGNNNSNIRGGEEKSKAEAENAVVAEFMNVFVTIAALLEKTHVYHPLSLSLPLSFISPHGNLDGQASVALVEFLERSVQRYHLALWLRLRQPVLAIVQAGKSMFVKKTAANLFRRMHNLVSSVGSTRYNYTVVLSDEESSVLTNDAGRGGDGVKKRRAAAEDDDDDGDDDDGDDDDGDDASKEKRKKRPRQADKKRKQKQRRDKRRAKQVALAKAAGSKRPADENDANSSKNVGDNKRARPDQMKAKAKKMREDEQQ